MLDKINIADILFIDLETAPQFSSYKELPDNIKKHWDKKAERIKKTDEEDPSSIYDRAAIYAEFGKIICISAGYFKNETFRIKSFFGHDEIKILTDFAIMLQSHFNKPNNLLCAHNGKEFDFPYLARRMVIHGIRLPDTLDSAGKKPWDIKHLDTMELWKFGDYKSYTSLDLMTSILNIPSPKNDIDGSDIARVYWQENDLNRIMEYCQRDVLAIAQVMRRFKGMELVKEDDIFFADQ